MGEFELRTNHSLLTAFAALLALGACSSGGGAPAAPVVGVPPPLSTPTDDLKYTVLTTRTLDADGDQSGLDAYDLIRDFAGDYVPGPIESPDLYPVNHPDVKHIYEDFDATVGNHFVFIIHRDIDKDRDRLENTDRQRNEIKTYDQSEEAVKGYEDETFIYRWKFRINDSMEVSTRFSHFFQLKAVGGDDSHPILTISGAERSGDDGIEVRYSPLQQDTILERQNWNRVTGEWLDAYCRVTFAESGDLRLIVTRMSDDEVIFNIDEAGLDLWRGTDASHFVRPKWGIYRSILDSDNLRPDEEDVRFAGFSVQEVMLTS
jgi:hypothetical protein